jgi:hypothetical protein
MHKRLLFLAILSFALAANAQSNPKNITSAAAWQPAGDFVTKTHAACEKISPGKKFESCAISAMSSAGASPEAVSFARELYKQSGEFGIMSGFQKVGPVDIAWVSYPLRSTYGLMLVNGKPRLIDLEDLKSLDQKAMQQSFQFQDLKNQFPNVNLWPGDRDGKTWPNSQTGSNGGLQFVVGYPLRNGCQTCANAGSALFTWNFDATGRFTGTSFQGMTPAPLQ